MEILLNFVALAIKRIWAFAPTHTECDYW